MLVLSNRGKMTNEHLLGIRSVDPRIELIYQPDQQFEEMDRLSEAEVLFGRDFPNDVLERAKELRWVQVNGTGVDHLVGTGLLDGRVVLTNTTGTMRIPMAEHILAMMLMWVREMPKFLQGAAEHRWNRRGPLGPRFRELYGSTLGVVGLGNIGSETAMRAKAFGMRVIGTRRSATAADNAARPEYVDELLPPTRTDDLLAESDFVLLSLPLTTETQHFISERELRLMKPTSFLVNISRGEIIDEPVLIQALREGWIGGAGRDVFTQEPLPPDHPLYDLPNVIITAHSAGNSTRILDREIEIFCENLRRYVAGKPLINVYHHERQY